MTPDPKSSNNAINNDSYCSVEHGNEIEKWEEWWYFVLFSSFQGMILDIDRNTYESLHWVQSLHLFGNLMKSIISLEFYET
jgi:hypothetical protein